MSTLTHLDAAGHARMVDIAGKPETARCAVARGRVAMQAATAAAIRDGAHPKGDVLAAARIAGIMAAKRTAGLIPLCHPVALTAVQVDVRAEDCAVEIEATASATGPTGVEMEALTAVSVAALTIYDMCKAADRAMRIEAIRVVRKEGGASGSFVQD